MLQVFYTDVMNEGSREKEETPQLETNALRAGTLIYVEFDLVF